MRPPLPRFNEETAVQKVRLAEDAWNRRDPTQVVLAYSLHSQWRNRTEFLEGREEIEAFLMRKWEREREHRLIKEVWGFLAPGALRASLRSRDVHEIEPFAQQGLNWGGTV